MTEFNFRSDSVDVEKIMNQIRERIRGKRGVDYTEAQIRALASVKLERFLDSKNVRSDLMAHYRGQRLSKGLEFQPPPPIFVFTDEVIHASSPSALSRLMTMSRRILNPVLRKFFAPKQREIDAYHTQQFADRQELDLDVLHFELLNNLVVNITRLAIDVNNQKMRLEAIAGRLDFDERRARALEGVVHYRPGATEPPDATAADDMSSEQASGGDSARRRQRRRGRR